MKLGLRHSKCFWIISAVLFLQIPSSFGTDYISPSNWFVSGDVGLLMPGLGSNTSVANSSTIENPEDLYSISKPGTVPTLALQGGYRWTRINNWFPSLTVGLRYQYLSSFNVNGTIEQYSSPANTNYDYNLNISSHAISVLGKLNIYQFKQTWSPYVTLGLGQAFASVGSYSETPLASVTPRISPDYQSKTSMNTIFSAGLGIDYIFNRAWSMSLGYEYANLGKLKTGNGAATWSNQALSLGTLTSSAILLSVHYQLPTRF